MNLGESGELKLQPVPQKTENAPPKISPDWTEHFLLEYVYI